jgi:hypothetical protein
LNEVKLVHHHHTARTLEAVAAEQIRQGIQETDDPEEIAFVEMIINGWSITRAFLEATGKGVGLDTSEQRKWSGAAQELRNKPEVKVMLQRRLREAMRNNAQDAALIRRRMQVELETMLDDELLEPKTKLAAMDRLGKMTHIRAFDPPAARKEDDEPKTASDVLDRIKKLVKRED